MSGETWLVSHLVPGFCVPGDFLIAASISLFVISLFWLSASSLLLLIFQLEPRGSIQMKNLNVMLNTILFSILYLRTTSEPGRL